jgi:Domain of unknown function (DUF4214)
MCPLICQLTGTSSHGPHRRAKAVFNGWIRIGSDTVVLQGELLSNAVWLLDADGNVAVTLTQASNLTQIMLESVERIEFGDQHVAFDIEGNAGQAYRVYQAAFDRTPDKEGLGYWISALDSGFSLTGAAASFIHSQEFRDTYGSPDTVTNQQFITLLYANVLDRAPDQGGLDYWLSAMNTGFSREAMLASFSESAENKQNVIGAIDNGIEYIPWLA